MVWGSLQRLPNIELDALNLNLKLSISKKFNRQSFQMQMCSTIIIFCQCTFLSNRILDLWTCCYYL